eukprot:TRINITY_DN67708_c0_g1_i1.p2 TRINITY_DN67708_c0_g1~~TRINITY_DN67708_c0_g1_i1.p2  ORF type:complete len:102 (+),score=4.24 TRINITY_DN67708_c0_g1_i1:169-474(+)
MHAHSAHELCTKDPAAYGEARQAHCRNFQSRRHIGQRLLSACSLFSHFMMQWMWKWWPHSPQTGGQSSPGILHSGQQASKGPRQMLQHSSSTSHCHVATGL